MQTPEYLIELQQLIKAREEVQAKIDEYMIINCPEQMGEEQLEAYIARKAKQNEASQVECMIAK